jgi:hypothetical protein
MLTYPDYTPKPQPNFTTTPTPLPAAHAQAQANPVKVHVTLKAHHAIFNIVDGNLSGANPQ